MDTIDPIRRSENMRRIKSRDTVPEMIVRKLVHKLGFRFRLHRKDLPGRPDLVFVAARKIIFVHGCFWHQHAKCADGRPPRSRKQYWLRKLESNKKRDQVVVRKLVKSNWQVLVIWECETREQGKIVKKLKDFLPGRN